MSSGRPGADAEPMRIVNPATDEIITSVPAHDREALDARVAAAQTAFQTWQDSTPAERATYLLRLADAIDQHAEELARIESVNVGKPIAGARQEIAVGAEMLRFFAGAARQMHGLAAGEYANGFTSMLRREPYGVVGIVAPWNYPFMLTCTKIGAVIGAGNTLVLKPADATPLSAMRLEEIARTVLPADVFSVITGTGPQVGQGLIEHRSVRAFALTGGTETGRRVAALGGQHLKKLHLELGSKNAALIFDDASPEEAARAIVAGAFVNAGQDCGAASRILVAESLYEKVVDQVLEQVSALEVGDPSSERTTMGPVYTKAHQQSVLGHIERARAAGAKVLTGGRPIGAIGAFVQPTVLTGVAQRSEIVQREVFGPVVTIQTFSSDAQAIEMANDVEAGLAASVFTNDVRRGMNAVRRLQFGSTWVNDHIPMALEFPWGGFKDAGNGCDNSVFALEQFTQLKHVMVKL